MNKLVRIAAVAAILALSALPATAQMSPTMFPGVGTWAGGSSQSGVSGIATSLGGPASAAAANAGGSVHTQAYGDPWVKIDQNHWGSASTSGANAGADFFANGFGVGFAGWLNQ